MASLAVNHGQIPICQPLTGPQWLSQEGGLGEIMGRRLCPNFWQEERRRQQAHLGLLSPADGQPAGAQPA